MRKTRTAHRLIVGHRDAALVAGSQRGGNAPCPAPACLRLNMLRQSHAQPRFRRRAATRDDADRREATPSRADSVEPGGAGIIIGSGHGGFGGRHQPRRQQQRGSRRQPDWNIGVGQIDAQMRGERWQRLGRPAPFGHRQHPDRREPHTHEPPRHQRLHPLDPRGEGCDRRARQHARRDSLGAAPDQCQPKQDAKTADRNHPRRPPMPRERHAAKRHRHRKTPHRTPRHRIGQHEPQGDPRPQRHRHPQRQLVALRLKPPLESGIDGSKPPKHADLKRGKVRARGAEG